MKFRETKVDPFFRSLIANFTTVVGRPGVLKVCRESRGPISWKAVGNSDLPLLPLSDKILLTNRLGQAYLWHTKRRCETTLHHLLERAVTDQGKSVSLQP